MNKENNLPTRKPTRLKNFDYSSKGAYFITICTENRRRILSRIVEDNAQTRQINDSQSNDAQTNVGGGAPDAPPVGKGLTVIGSTKRVFTRSFSNQTNESRLVYAPSVGHELTVINNTKTIELLPYGKIAEKHLKNMSEFYDNICVDRYVIMPNHIHIILIVSRSGASGTPPPTKQSSAVSGFVSTFKRFCNKEYGENIWQKYFYDHIIRNRKDYEEHIKYVAENPTTWYYDELYTEK